MEAHIAVDRPTAVDVELRPKEVALCRGVIRDDVLAPSMGYGG
jgi:hypothetical protein